MFNEQRVNVAKMIVIYERGGDALGFIAHAAEFVTGEFRAVQGVTTPLTGRERVFKYFK